MSKSPLKKRRRELALICDYFVPLHSNSNKTSQAECIIFPDIHGRDFWKSALRDDCEWETNTYIFLGDFFDPYPYEHISVKRAISNFIELQKSADELKSKGKTVVTLIGNHDAHYINWLFDQHVGGVRKSRYYARQIRSLLTSIPDFTHSIAYEMVVVNKRILFTHAGVTLDWYNEHENLIGELTADNLNQLTHSDGGWISLCDVSWERGGYDNTGSCIYADLNDHYTEDDEILPIPNYNYQVFGHTQQEKFPVINNRFAMLDCRHPFAMTTDLKFHQID